MATLNTNNALANKGQTKSQERLSPAEKRRIVMQESLEYYDLDGEPTLGRKPAEGKYDIFQKEVEAFNTRLSSGSVVVDTTTGSVLLTPDKPAEHLFLNGSENSPQLINSGNLKNQEQQTPLLTLSPDLQKALNEQYSSILNGAAKVAETTISGAKDVGQAVAELGGMIVGEPEEKKVDPVVAERKHKEAAHIRRAQAAIQEAGQIVKAHAQQQSAEDQVRILGRMVEEQDLVKIGVNPSSTKNKPVTPHLIFSVRQNDIAALAAQTRAKMEIKSRSANLSKPVHGADMNRDSENRNMSGSVG